MKKIFFMSMIYIFLNAFFVEFFKDFKSLYSNFILLGFLFLIFSGYFFAKGIPKNISIFCFSLSFLLLFLNKPFNFNLLYKCFDKSVGIICIFTVLPLLTFPIEKGNYSLSIRNFISQFNKNNKVILIFLILFHWILTIVLNISSILLMQEIIRENNFSKKYLTRMYTAGYCCFMIFSPFDGLLNMVLSMYSIKYYQYFSHAFFILLFILILSIVLVVFSEKETESSPLSKNPLSPYDKKKVLSLIGNILFLISLTILGDYLFVFESPMLLISLIVFTYSLIWSSYNFHNKEFKIQCKSYIEKATNFGTIIIFLISTNCLGEIIKNTSLGVFIANNFSKLIFLPNYLLMFSLIFLTVILALIGVHMLIPITTIIMIIKPEFLGLSPISYPLFIMCCWISAMCISPFVPFSAVVAEAIKEDIFIVTWKYNKNFTLLLILLCPFIILLI